MENNSECMSYSRILHMNFVFNWSNGFLEDVWNVDRQTDGNIGVIVCYQHSLQLKWDKWEGASVSKELSRDMCFPKCGIVTGVDSDEPVQPTVKLRTSKWCSVSSLRVIEYSSDKQRLWSDCAYAQADLRLCWSHIPHCWKSYVTAQFALLFPPPWKWLGH